MSSSIKTTTTAVQCTQTHLSSDVLLVWPHTMAHCRVYVADCTSVVIYASPESRTTTQRHQRDGRTDVCVDLDQMQMKVLQVVMLYKWGRLTSKCGNVAPKAPLYSVPQRTPWLSLSWILLPSAPRRSAAAADHYRTVLTLFFSAEELFSSN